MYIVIVSSIDCIKKYGNCSGGNLKSIFKRQREKGEYEVSCAAHNFYKNILMREVIHVESILCSCLFSCSTLSFLGCPDLILSRFFIYCSCNNTTHDILQKYVLYSISRISFEQICLTSYANVTHNRPHCRPLSLATKVFCALLIQFHSATIYVSLFARVSSKNEAYSSILPSLVQYLYYVQ